MIYSKHQGLISVYSNILLYWSLLFSIVCCEYSLLFYSYYLPRQFYGRPHHHISLQLAWHSTLTLYIYIHTHTCLLLWYHFSIISPNAHESCIGVSSRVVFKACNSRVCLFVSYISHGNCKHRYIIYINIICINKLYVLYLKLNTGKLIYYKSI